MKILIIEDDEIIAQAMCEHIKSWDYECKIAEDFKNIIKEFTQYSPHLVLLDVNLPFYNGYYWCTEIRRISQVPIIFISSASDNMNIIMAMNMGGDDFLVKPFDLQVLSAKIQAMLRRSYDFANQIRILEHNGVCLNLDNATFLYQGNSYDLTKNEFQIMQILMERRGKVVSRNVLMEKLWESDSFIDENTLNVNVNRLRKKLESAGLQNFIKTKKGIGYEI